MKTAGKRTCFKGPVKPEASALTLDAALKVGRVYRDHSIKTVMVKNKLFF